MHSSASWKDYFSLHSTVIYIRNYNLFYIVIQTHKRYKLFLEYGEKNRFKVK